VAQRTVVPLVVKDIYIFIWLGAHANADPCIN